MPLVRSSSMRGFASLVRSLGGDPVRIAQSVGVPVEALDSDDVLVPLVAHANAFEQAATELRCPDFGLRLSDQQDLSGLGPLAVAIQHSPTMADALECASRYLSLRNQGSTIKLEPDPYEVRGVVGLRHVWHFEGPRYRQVMDNILLNMHRVVELLAGPDYGLRSVEMGYRPPAATERYLEAFGGQRINVDRPISMLRVRHSLLQEPIAGAQTVVRDMALYYLAEQETPAELVTTVRVRAVAAALMGTGRLGLAGVARSLELSSRTLQRRLEAEGTSVAAVIDETRRDAALTWLADPRFSIAEIAAMLDFADQATFSRAARRWWGVTPTRRRQALHSG